MYPNLVTKANAGIALTEENLNRFANEAWNQAYGTTDISAGGAIGTTQIAGSAMPLQANGNTIYWNRFTDSFPQIKQEPKGNHVQDVEKILESLL